MRHHIFIVAILLTATLAVDQVQANDAPKTGQWGANEWAWTTVRWTGDEKPYRRTRIYIDKFIAKGQSPADLARKYKSQAQDWRDPIAQFRWAYAAYESARKVNFVDQGKTLSDIAQALKDAADDSSTRNYEYTRLRFLSIARENPYHKLKAVGERLVRHNPKDYEARFYLVEVLDPGLYDAEKKLAIAHTQTLIRAFPKKPTIYSLLGSVYWKSWLKSKTQADADKAIAGYRKYLQIAPSKHRFRKQAQAIITSIERQQAQRRKI